jgi:beta-lactamase class A
MSPTPIVTRRVLLVAAASSMPLVAAHASGGAKAARIRAAARRLAAIEAALGGRLGVAVLDTGDETALMHRADERFPMCSTFKFLAVAAVLKRAAEGREQLDRFIPYSVADLERYAPVTRAHVAEGGMRIGALCAAALEVSDNTAANLLLKTLGGPAGVTRYARSVGDAVTRLDRTEPTLNTAIPGDPRDTTNPGTMARDLRRILLEGALPDQSSRRLEGWMVAATTGAKRLRAGLPSSWRIGDKTGSGDYGTANVVAILRPPARAPILAALYLTDTAAPAQARDAAHAEMGRIIAATF